MTFTARLNLQHRPSLARCRIALALLILGALTPTSAGDSVALVSSRIAMRNCVIQAIQSAQVFYLDPAGQRQRRAVEEVWALSFDGLPRLDDAEQAIADRDYDAARKRLLEALIATDSEMQQLWVRNRLLRVHGLRDEYAEACAHLAEIFMLDPDPYWARIEPRCDATPTTFAAAAEAMAALRRAERAVKVQAIQQAIDSMQAKLAPLHDELKASYTGPPVDPGATISGVAKSNIGTWNAPSLEAPPPAMSEPGERGSARRPDTPAEPASTARPEPEQHAGPEAPRSINEHLSAGRYGEALAICTRVAQSLDNRNVGEFLFQYGEALRHTGKPRDAAVMYMRAAVLYPACPLAGPALIETALLYRDTFHRPDTARRLLQRVVQDAERAERHELAQRASTLLSELTPPSP